MRAGLFPGEKQLKHSKCQFQQAFLLFFIVFSTTITMLICVNRFSIVYL